MSKVDAGGRCTNTFQLRCSYTHSDQLLNIREYLKSYISEHNPDMVALTKCTPNNIRHSDENQELLSSLKLVNHDLYVTNSLHIHYLTFLRSIHFWRL